MILLLGRAGGAKTRSAPMAGGHRQVPQLRDGRLTALLGAALALACGDGDADTGVCEKKSPPEKETLGRSRFWSTKSRGG